MKWIQRGIGSVMGGIIFLGPLPDVKLDQQYSLTKTHLFSEEPGFYEVKSFGRGQKIGNEKFLEYFDSVLVLQILCELNQSLPIPYSDRKLSWSAKGDNSKNSSSINSGVTDRKGYARIRLRSDKSARGSKLVFLIEESQYEIELGVGPYNLYLKKCTI